MKDVEMTSPLLEPLQLGPLGLRNRVMFGAVSSLMEDMDGGISEQMIDFFSRRAEGGASVVTLGVGSVMPFVRIVPRQLAMYNENLMPGLVKITEAIHKHGAAAAVQLHHAGRLAVPEYNGGRIARGPSKVSGKWSHFEEPEAFSVQEIVEIVSAYGNAADRAKRAGFDIIEIHAAHGHGLPQQFLSPYTNQREDEYGGNARRRSRFAIEVIREVKSQVGSDFPIIFRLSVDEYVEGGLRLDDALEIVPWLAEEGISALSVSAGNYDSYKPMAVQPPSVPHKALVHLSGPLKDKLDIPVFVAGRIINPDEAESVLRDCQADAVVLVRALYADPDFVKKVEAGHRRLVRPCVGCMWCLRDCRNGSPTECAVNPETAHEGRVPVVHRPKTPADVLVIGGGPAGMEAARVAAHRGHSVQLWERNERLGGNLNLTARVPFKSDYGPFVDRMADELDELGVKVSLNNEVTLGKVVALDPSAVVVATGSKAVIEPIVGLPDEAAIHSMTIFGENADIASIGEDVVVIGGSAIACDAAEMLAISGRNVTLLERSDRVARDAEAFTRWEQTRNRFRELGVTVLTQSKAVSWANARLRAIVKDEAREIEANAVIVGTNLIASAPLYVDLLSAVPQVVLAGDCRVVAPTFAGCHDAVHGGYRAGWDVLPDQYV